MSNINQIFAGQVFGHLIVVEYVGSATNDKSRLFNCKCECGKEIIIKSHELKNGKRTSCGCKNTYGAKHGQTIGGVTKEYRAWCHMKERCTNEMNHAYKDYGGRGIRVCGRWLLSFADFLEDVGQAPSKNHTLERIDVNGHYEPGNIKWATWREQHANRRNNVWAEGFGKKLILAEWGRYLGLHEETVRTHLKNGKTIEQIASFGKAKKHLASL